MKNLPATLPSLLLLAASLTPAAGRQFRILDLRQTGTNNTLRITWSASPGTDYQLQRLAGDHIPERGAATWVPVASVRATTVSAFAEDTAGPLVHQRFYRVIQLRPSFRIIDIVRVNASNAYRIRWESNPGNTYQLQHPAGNVLNVPSPFDSALEWVTAATVYATGTVASAVDEVPPHILERFYRVALVTNVSEDVLPPTVVFEGARFSRTSNGLPALILAYTATDNVGVTDVRVSEGTSPLGPASAVEGRWLLTVPINPGAVQTRFFSASARDAAGNQGQCGPTGLLVADPSLFVPATTNGLPMENQALVMVASNRLGDFIFRPGGRPRPGAAVDFFLRFPEGASLVESNGQTVMEFSRVSAGFETNAPLQLATPLERAGGPPRRLVAGPLGYTNLADLFNLADSNGVALVAFNRFPLRWRGGTLDDRGLVGGQFRLELPNLPLPEWSGACAEGMVELSRDRTLRIPFSGEFRLPDGTAQAPRLRVGCGSPLWLSLRADGNATLEGPVEICWPSGASVEARLRFDDPQYHIVLTGSGLRVQAVSNLVDLLPANPAGCVPAGTDTNQLAQAARCLDKFARAYGHFCAAVAASASNAPPSGTARPDYLSLAADALEAWGYSAAAGPVQALPLDAIASLVGQVGHQAAGAPELPEVLAYRNALLRARAAVQAGGLTGSAGARAELEAALDEAEAAALGRARQAGATLSLADMRQAARLLLEPEALRQQIGLPANPAFADALESLFRRTTEHLADSLRVQPGVFIPDANPGINGMNRFAAMELLRDVLRVQADAQMLGIELGGVRLEELAAQLGVRLLRTVNAALDSAEAARDLPAMLLAFQDYLELTGWAQQGVIPETPALAPLFDPAVFESAANRLLAVWAAELDRPYWERTVGRQASDLRAALRVLREVPGTASWPVPAIARAYDQLEVTLTNATLPLRLSLQTNLVELLELLEAGTLHRELGARFSFPQPVSWENARLPEVVNRIKAVALAARGWGDLDQAVRLLLNAADRAGLAGDQTLRRAYLQQAAVLLGTSREVSRAMMQDARGLLRAADFALPGEVFLEEPSGYALYNRQSGTFHGAARGQLRLPKWSLALTVQNASFDTRGNFDLSAYGSINFTNGRLAIPSRQPLHFYYGPERGWDLLGAAELALANGMRFDAFVALTDPIYRFKLSARGLEFDLGEALVLHRPVLPAGAVDQFGEGARNALADYLRGLNGALDTLITTVTNYPTIDPASLGRPPEFDPPQVTLELATVNAWVADVMLRVQAGLSNASAVSLKPVQEFAQRLNQTAQAAATTLETEEARLNRIIEAQQTRAKAIRALNALPAPEEDRSSPDGDLGDPQQDVSPEEYLALVDALRSGALQDAAEAAAFLTPDLPGNLPKAATVARALYRSVDILELMDGDLPPLPNLSTNPCEAFLVTNASYRQRANALTLCAARRHAATYGLDPISGLILNTNLFHGLSETDIEREMRVLNNLSYLVYQHSGETEPPLDRGVETLLLRQRQILNEMLQRELREGHDPVVEFMLSTLLLQNEANGQMQQLGPATVESMENLVTNIMAVMDDVLHTLTNHDARANWTYQDFRTRCWRWECVRNSASNRVDQRKGVVDRETRVRLGLDRENPYDPSNFPDATVPPNSPPWEPEAHPKPSPDFLALLSQFLERARPYALFLPGQIHAQIDLGVDEEIQALLAQPVGPELLAGGCREAEALLAHILGLMDWIGRQRPADFAAVTNLQLCLSNLTFRVNAVAEAQRAWWLVDRYQEALRHHTAMYAANSVAGLSNALRQARSATLAASERISTALTALFEQVRYEDVVFQLPGRVEIPNLFGRLCYNRLSGFLEGCFGGRLEFPEAGSNVFFEITEACLANNGSYHLLATNALPLSFGHARLAAGLNVTGTAAGVATFLGNGTLTVSNGPPGEQTFSVAVAYDQNARRLACDALAQNLDLRFSDDFVLFDAGFGFDLTAANPSGEFRLRGAAGLFARQHPLPETVQGTNFHLLVTNLSTAFGFREERYDFVLSNGVVVLPEWFRPGLCPGSPPGSGPAVALSPARPLRVHYRTDGGQPPLTFEGQVSFTNLGVSVPGLDGLRGELCRGTLVLVSNNFPVVTNLQGALEIPLPPGGTSRVDLVDGSWSVGGFPQGKVRFSGDLLLVRQGEEPDPLELWLRWTNCPAGAALSASADWNGQGPAFGLEGGLELRLPLSVLSEVNGDHVRALACGSVRGSAAGVKAELNSLTLSGTYHFGGLEGVTLTNAQIVLTNLNSLFDPTDTNLFLAQMSGILLPGEGITASLNTGQFTFVRKPNGTLTPDRLHAEAQVTLKDGPTFGARLDYQAATRTFSFDSQVTNLVLRLADDLVIFDAGLGFTVANGGAAGQLRAGGTAGLFARQKPLPAQPQRTNFHLYIDHVATAITYAPNQATLTFSNGTLHLPEFFGTGFCSNAPPPFTGPQVLLAPATPLQATVNTMGGGSVTLSGALDFRNFGFRVPGLTNLGVDVCSARLMFPPGGLPVLDQFNAWLSLPLPDQTALIGLTNLVWRLDGFPEAATIVLGNGLQVFTNAGFTLEFLAGSGLGFTSTNLGGQVQTACTLFGGLRGTFPADLLCDAESNGSFSFQTSGSFRLATGQAPTVAMDSLRFVGRIKLGGSDGLELLGVDANGIPDPDNPANRASIELSGLTNLFQLAPDRPFEVLINGAVGSAELVYFGLGNTRFVFDGVFPEPQFLPGSVGFREGTQLALLGQQLLPLRITAGSLTFLNPALPWNQLFRPQNLRLTLSGVVDISLAPPDPNSPQNLPRLFGMLDNVGIAFPNGFSGPPEFSVNTFALTLENLTIGDMAGLTGGLAVGNLNRPSELFFAGTVGGGFNGVGIKAIVASRLDGLLGVCLNVNAGPAGIPLDGGALGGILFTGAEGGVSFLNAFSDPCDFKAYLGLNPDGTPAGSGAPAPVAPSGSGTSPVDADGPPAERTPMVSHLPVLTWPQLAYLQALHEQTKALRAGPWAQMALTGMAPDGSGAVAYADPPPTNAPPCPTGDCPPATLNLLCQRHPSIGEAPSPDNYQGIYRDRVIFKFSSLDRRSVDSLLAAANINLQGSSSVVASSFAGAMTNWVGGLIPRPPATLPPDQAQQINQFIGASLAALRDLVAVSVQAALEAAAGQGRTPLEALYEAAYAGVKCVDVTIQLKGTFSYAPVSVALSATGGAVGSTAGSAGILGSVNLFGLPVGTGEFFYSLTDTNGALNPSLCGGMRVALGPLSLGQLGLAAGCDECLTGELQALRDFAAGLSQDLSPDALALFRSFLQSAAGARVPDVTNRPINTLFGPPGSGAVLTPKEQIAVLTALINLPRVVQFLEANPGALDEAARNAVRALGERTFQLVLAIYQAVNPRLSLCGEAEPKLFGFSLTGGATLVGVQLFGEKTRLAADVMFSPSFIMANLPFWLMSGGVPVVTVAPPLDEATMGFALGLPMVNEPMLRLMTTNPAAYGLAQLNHLLDSATLTFGYELIPFGLKLADAEGRVLLPTLANHPDNPNGFWHGNFAPPTNPDRATVLKAALDANRLALATWDGKSNNLAAILPSYPVLATRELGRDYFPYGGFLGAGKLLFPKPIYDAPPMADLMALFAPIDNPGQLPDRLSLAGRLFTDYILGTTNIGQLVTYIPAPRPPPAFWQLAEQTPQELMNSITRMDMATLAQNLSLWPAEQFLMQGNARGQVLGLPLGDATVLADPAQGLLRLSAAAAQGWLTNFISAGVTGEVRSAEYILRSTNLPPGTTAQDLKPEVLLSNAWSLLNLAMAPGATEAQQRAALSNAIARITDTLPKASLVAAGSFRVPPELTNVLTATGAGSIYAFSPRFGPSYGGVGPVADARRNGGVALMAQLNFANYVNIPNAQLGVAVRPVGLPVLSGQFDVNRLAIPGLALENAHFGFNSDPPVNNPYIAASGTVQPIAFTNPVNGQVLLTIRNLTNAGAPIAASFDLRRAASGPPLPGFAIGPARLDMPMLGPGVLVRIHGASTNNPFAFSSTGPWTAKVSIAGQLALRDLVGNEVARLGAAAGQQFSAELAGTGMQMDRLAITVLNDLELIVFPGTAYAYTNRVGVGTSLVISRDGNFALQSQLGATLDLRGLGFGSISASAGFLLTPTNFVVGINNNLYGGALTNFPGGSISGSLTITRNGVSLAGDASVPPFSMGAFLVRGNTPDGWLVARLDNAGLYLLSGARLRIQAGSYEQGVDVLTLNDFVILGNGDFNVSGQNGALSLPSFFTVTQGIFSLSRSNGVARLFVQSPALTLFPGQPFQTPLSGVFNTLDISSDGRFYASRAVSNVGLPGAFKASGQLEVGYQPDPRQPGLGVNTTAISFGTVDYGASSNRVLYLTNTGVGTLFVTCSSSWPEVFTAVPFSVNLEPQQVAPISVRFTPASAASFNATLTLTHNAGGAARTINLSGTGRAIPVLRLSSTNLAFGDLQVGSSATRLLRVDNPGLVSLVVTCRVTQAGTFSISPASFTVPSRSNALVSVLFAPASLGSYSTTLEVTANDKPDIRQVTLSGRGNTSRWYLQGEGAGRLRAVAVHSNGQGLAVGEGGMIRHTRNHGHSWFDRGSWPALQLHDLYAAALSEMDSYGFQYAVAAGDDGRVVEGNSMSGQNWNWQQSSTFDGYTFRGAAFVPGTNRYVVAGSSAEGVNLVWVKGNGYVWSEVAAGRKVNALCAAAVSTQKIGLIGMDGGRMLRSTDLATTGTNWVQVFSSTGVGNITGVALAGTGRALFVTDSGRIYQSSNSGSSWTLAASGKGHLAGVSFAGDNVAYAVNQEGQIHASTNTGSGFVTWATEESGLDALHAVAATSSRAWCVGESAHVYNRPSYDLNRGILNYSPDSLDFGLVVAGASKSRVLTLYNRGLAPLQINSLRPMQFTNMLSFSPVPPFSIPAKQNMPVNVYFNPPGNELVYSLGDLLIESGDPDGTQTNKLWGWTRTNGWVLKPSLPNAAGQTARDVQMVSDTIAYAITPTDIYRTSNGGATWTLTGKPPVDGYHAVHFTSTTSGFVCGGSFSRIGQPTPRLSFIYQTTDSGANWTARYVVSNRWPILNIHFADATTGYALTGSEVRTLPPYYPGIILRTANGGATWTEITNPIGTGFNGWALHTKSANQLFVSHNDILYQSINSGGGWTDMFGNGGKSLRHVFFYNNTDGHAIGAQGTVWQASNGGGLPSYWSQQASFVTHDLNDGCLVGGLDGWITLAESAPTAAIYRKNKGSWVEQLVESPLAGPGHLKPTVVSGRSTTIAVALGTDGCVRRLESFVNQPLGVAVAPALVDLGSAPVGTPLSKTFTLRNVGDRTLTVSNILVDGVAGFNNGFRATTSTPFAVGIGGSYTVTVVASNQVAGTHNAEMQFLTDGAAPTVTMGVRSAALAPPEVVVFQTDPPGLPLRIDGVLQTAPVGYTICVGAAAAYEWELGSVHTVEAPGSTTVNGQEMLFAGWLPYADRVWTYTAELSSKTYTAGYVVGAPAAAGSPPPGGTSTNGLPYGPFLRLSNASISNAVLGNFSVSGSVLLCSTNIEASLATTAVRMPANVNVAPLAEVSAGSWRFQFANNQLLLNARSPAMKLLGNAVTPPSSLNLWLDNTGHFRSDFSLSRGWPVAPGLLEFGPGSLTLAYTNFFSLASAGEIRLLRKPDSADWAFKTNWNLTFRDGPFTNSLILPDSVLRLTVPIVGTEFLEVRGGSNSRFELWRDNYNVFSARLLNLVQEVMDQAVSTNSITVSSAGLVVWSSLPPPAPFTLGPFRWTPGGPSTLYWNIKNGSLSFTLAGGTVTAPTVTGWPNPQFPSVSFDSKGDFEKTISLATFRSMPLGSGGYATFKRSGGILSMRVRGQQSFFGSSMQEGFDINSAGSVTGFFSGGFSVDFGPPMGRIDFANVYLSYDSAQPSYQFQGQLRVALNDFRIQVGSAGGQVCHLLCDGSSCTPTICLSSP